MTQEIIEMAKQVGLATWHKDLKKWQLEYGVEAFAKLVADKEQEKFSADLIEYGKAMAAVEREACAKLVEVPDNYEDWEIIGGSDGRELLNGMAAKIRARGEA